MPTILALTRPEQLVTLPTSEFPTPHTATTVEQIAQIEAVDHILCFHDTPITLFAAAWQRFPQSHFWVAQDHGAWLDWQTQQIIATEAMWAIIHPLPATTAEPMPQAVAAEQPKKSQAAISHEPSSIKDEALLFEIFKLSAWGLDKKENRERVEELLCLAALRSADLVTRAQKNKNQGNSANQLATKLETLFKNNAANLNTWFDDIQNNTSLPKKIKKYLKTKYNKLKAKQEKRRTLVRQETTVQTPIFTSHHPNSLRHLPVHSHWEIVIDETGQEFEQTGDLSINDHNLGRYVALAIPKGKAKLIELSASFHAAEEQPALLDQVINNILSQPVGVLGITAKDPLSFICSRWFTGVYHLLQLALRLLPLPSEGSKQVHIFIEQRSGFDAKTDFQALKQLLLSELQSIDEKRFSNFGLSIEIVPKGGHPYLAHVDALAHCWGGSSAKQRLAKAKLKGHCFLTPNSGEIERIYAALDGKHSLKPHEWLQAASVLAEEPEHSLLHEALQQLGTQCQTQPTVWKSYLQEIQYQLNQKTYHPKTLDAVLNWLHTYRPAEQKLPPLLQLRFQTAQLAADNHMGRMSPETLYNLFELGSTLQNEAAPEVVQMYNRLATAATNAFEFDTALQITQHALKLPEIAAGSLNYGKLLSCKGQVHAFLGEHTLAENHFVQAIQVFETLSDPNSAAKDIRQTQIYRLHNHLDAATAWEDIQTIVTAIFGADLNRAAQRFSGSTDNRFEHHALLRLFITHPQPTTSAQKTYLDNAQNWQTDEGHPWQLINLWRGWLAHFAGNDYIAAESFNRALQNEPDGLTLQWIAFITAILAERLGLSSSCPYPIAHEQNCLANTLLHAPHHALQALQQSDQQPQHLLAALKACLPFNFK